MNNKKTALAAGGAVAILVLAALAVPALIDWNRWKPEILAKAEAALGRKVEIADLKVRLLPSPAATATGVAVANAPGGKAAALATAQALRVRLKLLPLLTGNFAIQSLELDRPAVTLEKLPDGRGNWEFAPAAKAEQPATAATEPAKASSSREIAINRAVVRDGSLAFPGGELQAIQAEVAMASLAGPWSAQGQLRWGDTPVTFEGAVDRPVNDRSRPIRLSLALPAAEATLELSALLAEPMALRGQLRLTHPKANAAGTLSVTPDEAAIPDLAVEIGEARASGSLVAALNTSPVQVDASLKAATLDLDKLPANRPAAAPAASAPAASPSPAPSPAPPPQAAAPGRFALPTGVAAHLDATADTVIWQGQAIRKVALDAMLEDGRLSLSKAAAALPGDTTVSLTGVLAAADGRPAFDGRLQAASAELRGLLSWLKANVEGMAPSALRRAQLDARLALAGDELRLPAVEAVVDNQRLRAAATLRLSGGWAATVAADRLELAPYLGKAAGRLGPLALDATITGDPGAGGTGATTVKGKAVAQGVELLADGRVQPGLDLALSAKADSFAPVVRLFAEGYRPRGSGPFAAAAKVSGDKGAYEVAGLSLKAGAATVTGHARYAGNALTAELAGGALDLDPFMPADRTGLLNTPRGWVPHPSPVVPAAAAPAAERWSREPIDLAGLPEAKVSLTAKSVSWQGWKLDAPSALLTSGDGAAALDKLTGTLLGGPLEASAKLTRQGLAGHFAISGADIQQAKLGAGPIQVTQGRLNGDAKWAAAGRSPYDLITSLNGDGRLTVADGVISGFDLPAVNQRLGDIQNIGSLLGLVQAGLSGGTTKFSSLTGTFRAERGVVTSRDLKLTADGGTATAETTLDLPRYTQDTRIAIRLAQASAPALGIRLFGALDNPTKAVDVNDLQRWLVERGLGKALSGKGGGAGGLEGLLGRKPKEPAAPDQQQSAEPPKKEKPADVLRGLLKGVR